MRLLGYDITRAPQRLLGFAVERTKSLPSSPSWGWGGWWPIIREPFTGAWQRNMSERPENLLAFYAVYSCVTLIASDIGKLRLRLMEQDSNGIWTETESPAFSPVLRKPNAYQNRIKFYEQWIVSKLIHGNTYVLKQRDGRGNVVAMYVLDPTRTKVLVAPNGDVFYQLGKDNLSNVSQDSDVVPASEIIHDVMVPLYHPLCGVSPLTACAMAASQGLSIQRNSTSFFSNRSQPGGILTAPGVIEDTQAAEMKKRWEENYTGQNAGRVAVLGNGLEFKPISVTAKDAELIEQLKWTGENVCSCFHVPPYMVGIGAMPTYNNIEALNQQYYTQCLQALIESIEIGLDEGLGLDSKKEGKIYGTEFDLDDLLRMDTATRIKAVGDAIKAGFLAPNEGRKKFDLKPVQGGDTPYLQQQNYSLAALDKRDQSDDPFASKSPTPAAPAADASDADNDNSPEALAATRQQARWLARDMFAA